MVYISLWQLKLLLHWIFPLVSVAFNGTVVENGAQTTATPCCRALSVIEIRAALPDADSL